MPDTSLGAYLEPVAWFWPGLVAAIACGLAAGRAVGKGLGVGPWRGAALVMSFAVVVTSTLTPSSDALQFGALGSGQCDLGRIGPPSIAELRVLGDPLFNTLLFIPLGVVSGTLPRGRRSIGVVAVSLALPFVIEGLQLVVLPLDRACQAEDVADNLTGLVLGLGLVIAARAVRAAARRRAPGQRPDPDRSGASVEDRRR